MKVQYNEQSNLKEQSTMTTLRSKRSFQVFIVFALLVCLLGSAWEITPVYAATLTVTKTADTNDGVCDSDCSLREAIAAAGSGDTITFDSALSGGTIYLNSTLNINKNLTIDGSALVSKITISGDSDNNGTGDVRVFSTGGSLAITLDSLIITKGSAGFGGAILNGFLTTLTINNSTISNNAATTSTGGGIKSDGPLIITNSTFSGNSSIVSGGAIRDEVGTMTVTNSTFSGNSSANGGAIDVDGDLTITNSTFSGNTATSNGGAIYKTNNPLTITNSTFSGNSAASGAAVYHTNTLNYANTIIANSTGSDCAGGGSIGTNTNNLVEDGTCSAALSGDPSLDALADNGGPTQTFALVTGSPAIDAGDDTTCNNAPVSGLDQRGVARPIGAHCDLGALEQDTIRPTVTSFTVTSPSTSLNVPITAFTASDNLFVAGYKITESSSPPGINDSGWTGSSPTAYAVGSYGSYTLYPWAKDAAGNVSAIYGSPAAVTVCGSAITVTSGADSGAGTLRQAITDACEGATITFDDALSGETIHLASTLTIFKDLTIDGSSLASKITLSGDSDNNGTGDVRVLSTTSPDIFGRTITLDSLIVAKGYESEGAGLLAGDDTTVNIINSLFSGNSAASNGGAVSNYGTVTITDSTFSGNSSAGSFGGGGAILNSQTLTIKGSTFSNNTTGNFGAGGALLNAAPATITNSTFSGNSATGIGGAIMTINDLTMQNSTISGNSALLDGGLHVDSHVTNLVNTIIANSTSGGDCSGTLATNTNNLVEDGSCSAALSGDPGLGALVDNGGPTQTFALLAGSSAIDAGDDSSCAAAPVNNRDQRGIVRPNGAHCDIGAYEYVDITAPTVTSFTATSPSASLSIPIMAFAASDDVVVTGYMITESAIPPAAGAAGWTGSAPTIYTVGSNGSHTLYPWAKDATGNVSLVYGSPVSVTVDTIAPTVTSFAATSPSTSLNIVITAFTASDNVAVAGYTITESSTPPSVSAAGWTASAPTIYTVGSDGSHTLYPWVKDAAGNVSLVFGSPANVTVDTSAPSVVSSVRANLNPTTAAGVDFIVTFSEAVTGVDATDFSLSTTGSISGAAVSGVSGSGTTYTVTVNTGSGSGTIRLDVADNDTIVDMTSNPLGGAGAGNGAFTSGEWYTLGRYRIYLPFVMRNE
jgi:CSLREA domain-containing protein